MSIQQPSDLCSSLDRAVWTITNSSASNEVCKRTSSSYTMYDRHYSGWLADKAVEEGYQDFLTSRIGEYVEVIKGDGQVAHVPPLLVALRYMSSTLRAREIQRLLDLGADPNEQSGVDDSVWESYLAYLGTMGHLLEIELELSVAKSLLLHGADPFVGKKYFSEILSTSVFSYDDLIQLANLCWELESSVHKIR
ncbi:hypothetical protein MMC28_008142 [Mycoblastus sanguinarius]|nr:hypothetical protein [Mycoblastus sanguinarius]